MLKELLFPLAVLGSLGAMLLPLPTPLLDLLLAGNVIIALILLISSFYISEPLKLSVLPTLLLLATLFRLTLNISSTRLIIGTGNAGAMIESFGATVVQGNIVVGVVIFLIITLVQFIVVAKGAERVAEVSARFTLDALPGKQMSIDADVRSGIIDIGTARIKREELQAESRFYGALDGAMKFVKGDSIAGLLITAINISGGLIVGIAMLGLDMQEALFKYSLLTVGDGLLSQIPALLNAVTAGIVVTRVSREDGKSLANELVDQMWQERKARGLVGALSIVLAAVPGLPLIPFLLVGTLALISLMFKDKNGEVVSVPQRVSLGIPSQVSIELGTKELSEKIGYIQWEVLARDLSESIFQATGILLKPIPIKIIPESSDVTILLRGIPTEELNCDRERSIEDFLTEKIPQFVLTNGAEIIDDGITRRLLDAMENESSELVSNVVPTVASVTQVTELLKSLLREQLPIQQLDIILQALAENMPRNLGEPKLLSEVRIAMKRVISHRASKSSRTIKAYTVEPRLDLVISRSEGILHSEASSSFYEELRDKEENIVIVSKESRMFLSEILRNLGIRGLVLAFEEIADGYQIEIIKELKMVDQIELNSVPFEGRLVA